MQRIPGLLQGEAKVFPTNAEQARGKLLCPNLPAAGEYVVPVDLAAIGIGIQNQVADLSNTKTAVEKMFESVAQKVEHVVRGVQRGDTSLLNSPAAHICKEPVHITVGGVLIRKQAPVDLYVQRAVRTHIAYFVTVVIRITGGKAKFGKNAVAGSKLLRVDQHILIGTEPVIRVGVQLPAGDSLYHQGLDPSFLQCLKKRMEFRGFPGLQRNHLDGAAAVEGHQPLICQFRCGAGIYCLKDHRQHPVGLRQRQNLFPLIPGKGVIPWNIFIFQGGRKCLQE